MPSVSCAQCELPAAFKLAAFYWGWRWPSGDRRAFKQLVCPDCSIRELQKFQRSAENPERCLSCADKCTYPGQLTVWASVYIPGKDKIEGQQRYCEPCFLVEEEMFVRNARRLPDRGDGGAGPSAPMPREDPWAAVGIHPQT